MRIKFALLTGLLVLGASFSNGQAWVNPGTSGGPDCGPFQSQYVGSTSWYCYYQGTFPWFDAGGGWTTILRVAAPASGAVQVKYDFFQLSNGGVDPVTLNMILSDGTVVPYSSDYTFALSPNQPSEVTLLSKHTDSGDIEANGSVHVQINCPDQATCKHVMPQLIYTYLPKYPWFLSSALSANVLLPAQPDSTAWSAVGMNDPQTDAAKNQIVSFVISNDSGSDQVYTVTAYDQTGKQVGQNATPTIVSGQGNGYLLHSFLSGLPQGLLKVRVSGTGTFMFTALQFNGPAATALVPVAEGTNSLEK